MELLSMLITHCLQSSVEKSQDEHGGNVALMIFGNPIISRLAIDFQQFLSNFSALYLHKKLSTTCLNDFQASNSVHWSSSKSFEISGPINIPSFSLASLLKNPNFSF